MAAAETTDLTSYRIAEEMRADIAERAAVVLAETGAMPGLAILTDNEVEGTPTQKYIDRQIAQGEKLGIAVRKESADNIVGWIKYFNNDNVTDGIIVELPLLGFEDYPAGERALATDELLSLIDPQKDIDDLTGVSPFSPATPLAIKSLLVSNGIDLSDPICIRGRGRTVGLPLAEVLADAGAEDVVTIDLDTPEDRRRFWLTTSHIIITATGNGHGLTQDLFGDVDVWEPKIVIDAGAATQTTQIGEASKVVGDVHPDLREFGKDRGWRFSAAVGGVGPLTVLHAFDNVVTAAETRSRRVAPSIVDMNPPQVSTANLPSEWWKPSDQGGLSPEAAVEAQQAYDERWSQANRLSAQ